MSGGASSGVLGQNVQGPLASHSSSAAVAPQQPARAAAPGDKSLLLVLPVGRDKANSDKGSSGVPRPSQTQVDGIVSKKQTKLHDSSGGLLVPEGLAAEYLDVGASVQAVPPQGGPAGDDTAHKILNLRK